MKKILLIGGAGYIGSVLTDKLLKNGFKVSVIDVLWFKKDTPLNFMNNFNYYFKKADLCNEDIINTYIKDVDLVINLAAVVGEPASKLFPDLTYKINYECVIKLIKILEKYNKKFIFFSTCSNYGIVNGVANENTPLKPLSLYAETKVNIEKYLMDKSNLDWIICRLSTVHGLSPRMRFDLTVNEFILKGFKDKYIDIFFPESNRPYIHTNDLSNIILELIKNFETTKNNVFNIGFNEENYQKIEIANLVKELLPETQIEIIKSSTDLRDYRVDFTKLHSFIKIDKTFDVKKSMEKILDVLKNRVIERYDKDYFYNTKPNI